MARARVTQADQGLQSKFYAVVFLRDHALEKSYLFLKKKKKKKHQLIGVLVSNIPKVN